MPARSPSPYLTLKYIISIIVLLTALITIYGLIEARRAQRELKGMMEREGLALADALAMGSQNAAVSKEVLEDVIARRLMDNAHLIDTMLERGAVSYRDLPWLASQNRLYHLEVRDGRGKPIADSRRGLVKPGVARGRPMGEYMGFYRPILEGKVKEAVTGFREGKFWRGKDYGVAIKRRNNSGVIVVMADAGWMSQIQKQIGIQALINDLKDLPGIKYISFQDKDLTYLAHSDPTLVGTRETDPVVTGDLIGELGVCVERILPGGNRVLEASKNTPLGIIRVGLSIEPLEKVWRKSFFSIFIYGVALLLVGIIGALAIFYDQRRHVMRVQELEADLRRKERLASLGDLASGVAHEVRNPLNSISLGLQRLQTECPTDEEGERFIGLMRSEVRRINDIIERFLHLARPPRMELCECDLKGLVSEVADLMRDEAQAKGVRIDAHLPPNPAIAYLDCPQIRQAFMNLALNAIQATPEGGVVAFGLEKRGKEWRIRVSDTGPGISPQVRERIFDPYFTTKEGGVGLGLTLAQRVVEEHGGRIEVESRMGKGTTFTVILPSK